MKIRLRIFFFLLVSALVAATNAQTPTTGDCLGSIPVCQSIYYFNSSPNGPGNYTDLPYIGVPSTNNCPGSCIAAGEQNTVWFTFTVQQSGMINFLITPNNPADDYDWAVYNITTNGCTDIYNGGMQVSCNYCLNTGSTGPNAGSTSWCEGPNNCTQYNDDFPGLAGETFVLMVDNFSSTTSGFTLDFTNSSAVIFDNIPPNWVSLQTPVACGATTLNISFSENILCSTISNGDFTINGPGGPYTVTNVFGANCALGGTMENNFTLTVSPAMSTAGTYTLNLVNTSGSVSDLCGNIAPIAGFNFTINGPNVSVSPANTTFCSPGSVVLTASGATSYTWTPTNGLSPTTGSPVTANPATSVVYTVTGNTNGCTANAYASVNVNPQPALTITQTPPGTICTGTQVTLSVTSNIPGTNFVWAPGGPGASITQIVNMTTTYTVTGTSPLGCSSSAAITVTVAAPLPVAVTPTSTIICNTITDTLTASGATTYAWSPATGLNTTSGAIVIANPSATTTYTVTGSGGGCAGTATAQVTVNPMPTATVTGGGNVCTGSSPVTITITLTGSPPWNLTYTDGVTPTTITGINTSPYTFTTSTPGVYTVNSVSDIYCSGSSTGAAIVNLYPLPNVTLAALTPLCLNTPAFALAGGSPAGGTYSGTGVTANNFNAVVAGVGNHNIIYTYTDANGCTNSDTAVQTVNALPLVNLPQFANTCLNAASFALSGGTPVGGTYSGLGVSANNYNPSVAGLGIHNIVYSFTDANNCTNSDTNTILVQALPLVTFSALPNVCLNEPPFALTGGNPAGGVYSGTGVTANNFDASTAGIGSHTISYTYTDSLTGCSNTATQTQLVIGLPVVTQQALPDVCITTPPFVLSGGSPAGGTYSGTGVVNNTFYPDSAGVGAFTITYTYTDMVSNCSNSATTTLNVAAGLSISVNPSASSVCLGNSVTLAASGASSYSWSPSTGLSATTGQAVISTPPVSIVYTITGSNADGCIGIANATVNIYPPVQVAFVAVPQNGCRPLNVQFLFTPTAQVQDSTYNWNFGDVGSLDNTSTLEDPAHIFNNPGNYIVTLTLQSVNGCTHSGTLPVNVYVKPVADFYWLPEQVNMEDPTVNFVDASSAANYWYWNFGDPASGNYNEADIAFPSHTYGDTGTYQVLLIVESNHGCADTAIKNITVYPEVSIFIPNAFTPDNNQLNDTWKPVATGIQSDGYYLDIYDRWGERIFTTGDYEKGWDGTVSGTLAPVGVYVWVMHYLDPEGKEYKRRGHVTLIR